MWIALILLLLILLLLLFPTASLAKGGGSYTVDAVGEKSQELKNFESQFYSAVNPLMAGLSTPLSGGSTLGDMSGLNGFTGLGNVNQSGQTSNRQVSPNQTKIRSQDADSWGSNGKAGHWDPIAGKPVEWGGDSVGWVYSNDNNAPAGDNVGGRTAMGFPVGNLYNDSGVPQPFDANTLIGQMFNDATSKYYTASGRYDDLVAQAGDLGAGATNMLKAAETAGDPWYGQAWDSYGDARNLIDQGAANLEYGSKAAQWYDDYARGNLTSAQNVLDTGQIPQAALDAMIAAITASADQSMGSSLNDLASRGVINSSVAEKSFGDLSNAVTNAMNQNYLDAINAWVSGYQGNAGVAAQAGGAFADNYLNYNNAYQNAAANMTGLGDSYAKSGSMRVGDYLNTAAGYNDALGMNVSEREGLMNDMGNYYGNAASPMSDMFAFLQQMQTDHWNSDKKDTVVKSGK